MNQNDIIDLSLPINQNTVAASLSIFFTVEELESIDTTKLKCPVSTGAVKACRMMEYIKKFDKQGKVQFKINCMIDISVIPNIHCILMTLKNGDDCETQFKCNPNSKNSEYIAVIFKKAINFSKFRNFEDIMYNRQNILRNFSAKMVADIGPDITIYKRLKYKLLEMEQTTNELKDISGNKVVLSYQIDNVEIKINSLEGNLFKFQYTNLKTNISDYCYLKRGYIGLDTLIIVFDRCINKIKRVYLDIEPEWITNNLLRRNNTDP